MDQELKQSMRAWVRSATKNSLCNIAEDIIKHWTSVPDPEIQVYVGLAMDVRMGIPDAIYALHQAMLINPTVN